MSQLVEIVVSVKIESITKVASREAVMNSNILSFSFSDFETANQPEYSILMNIPNFF